MNRILLLTLTLAAVAGCAYSFGGDVRAIGTPSQAVHMTSFGGDIDVPVAPRGVKLRSFGGDVTIGDVDGMSQAASFGGDILVETLEGSARLASFGGAVEVGLADGATGPPHRVQITSFGGDVRVRVPADYSARVDIRIRSRRGGGEVDSDFDLAESRGAARWGWASWRRSHREVRATGTLGDGRNLIRIRTVDANVRLERI